MDLHPNFDPQVIVLSTSDNADVAEPTQYPGVVSSEASRRAGTANPFTKSFRFSPPLLSGSFKTSGTSGTHTRKCSETNGRQTAEHLVNNYYYITGGRGGSGGWGGDQGGDGGAGHGPSVYFSQPQARDLSGISWLLGIVGKRTEFRTIRLGDVNLIKEFKMCSSPQSSLVDRQTPGASVRRVYTAKLEGHDSGHMTVAMYEGDGAKKAWKQHLTKYEAVRHPNIVQLYGLISTKKLYAMVFHNELIPYHQFLRRFEHSPVLSTYIMAYCTTEYREATDYICDVIGPSMETSVWIRPSTGQLCLDLAQGGPETSSDLYGLIIDILRLENVSLDTPDSEDIIISSLSEDQYHELCSQSSIARFQYFQVSTAHAVGPGIFQLNSQCGTCVSITEPLQTLHELELHWYNYGNAPDEQLPNSWIRYDFPRMFALNLELNLWFPPYESQKAWLAQANHIFAELQELDYVEDYVCIYHTEFMLRITDECDIPEGYLFVCPPQDFHTGTEPHANLYQWPACPAYWSLDPSGADRLSMEDARILGFPAIHIETRIWGYSWDHSVYEGLRRFHEGKEFDPYSREVARQLEYSLFEVLSNRVPFPAREVDEWSGPWWCKQDDSALCREFGHYL
ncbi:MFS general substrate transporter [Mycena sanguinolenta]|uniref:MFS general substrate transporter n=1 Tax=Mycena sanguinolenta TaxID=230812 RepID=A0A8H7CWT9_9AGAR|nr:MFS general substrate transporter [Mycena sanguinolenta]